MKYTNKLNLPQPLVDAVIGDKYSRGKADISVTGLLNPPRQTTLIQRHWDELEEDVSDRIWALLGKTVHNILESTDSTGIVEKRLFMDIGGWTISGAIDRFVKKDKHLSDYKVTSSYKIKGGMPESFEWQTNFYRELCLANNIEIDTADIVVILRDWSKMEAFRSPDYPRHQVVTLPVDIWSREVTQARMLERVTMHQEALKALPECTVADKWEKPTKFAVMKKGAKRATKLYDTKEAAEIHAEQSKALYVEDRPGVQTRCLGYCAVAPFCAQYQKTLTKE